ncbi:hypothetical protein ACFFUE_08565 [Bergeyella porcorum]|uniref:hypothetical protein n=1 Tax=Bergeyella porcorum TaxID=1735111 RepID=UPI0035E8B62C
MTNLTYTELLCIEGGAKKPCGCRSAGKKLGNFIENVGIDIATMVNDGWDTITGWFD